MGKKSVRAMWAAKLDGKLQPKTGAGDLGGWGMRKPFRGVVLGIDPSLRGTGLAVLVFEPNKPTRLLFSQTVRNKPKLSLPQCLAEVSLAVTRALSAHPVSRVAVEQTIYVQNFRIAQILGAARGAAIAAAAVRGLPVYEYPPLRVKQAVVSYGRASKQQVARQVQSLLNLPKTLPADESDAAAVALCHALTCRE